MISNKQLVSFAENCIGRGDTSIQRAFNTEFPEEDFDELTVEQYQTIDDIVFECSDCGWLCSSDEMNTSMSGENICDDCSNYEDDEDEEDLEDDEDYVD